MALDLEDLSGLDGSEGRNISAGDISEQEGREAGVATYCQRLCIPFERCVSTRVRLLPESRRNPKYQPSVDSQG